MKQVEFEQNMATLMQLPVKTIHLFLDAMIAVIQDRLRVGDLVFIPRFGRWYSAVRQGRNIYNPYYETVIHYNAKAVIKFKEYYYSGKVLAPTWKGYISVKSIFDYPQCDVAMRMSLLTNLDLLLCNQFVYVIADELIYRINEGERVVFNNLGSFDYYWLNDKTYKNPRTGLPDAYPARRKIRFQASRYLKDLVN